MKRSKLHEAVGVLVTAGQSVLAEELIQMSKRSLPDKEKVFTYGPSESELWDARLTDAQEYFKTSFDRENDDNTSDNPKVLKYKWDSSYGEGRPKEDSIKFHCRMMSAGGDWQMPCRYFRCQMVDNTIGGLGAFQLCGRELNGYNNNNTDRDNHIVLIPPKDAGNNNLVKNDKGDWTVLDNGGSNEDDIPDPDHKALWKWLEAFLMESVKKYKAGEYRRKD